MNSSVIGKPIPSVRLESHVGTQINLRNHAPERGLVIYTYPGTRCSPENGCKSDQLDAAVHQAFAMHEPDFVMRGCVVLGVSTGVAHDLRREALTAQAAYPLLSDPRTFLADALGLATFDVDGRDCYCRTTIVALDGAVRKVFHPIRTPEHSAAQVVAWMKVQGF